MWVKEISEHKGLLVLWQATYRLTALRTLVLQLNTLRNKAENNSVCCFYNPSEGYFHFDSIILLLTIFQMCHYNRKLGPFYFLSLHLITSFIHLGLHIYLCISWFTHLSNIKKKNILNPILGMLKETKTVEGNSSGHN